MTQDASAPAPWIPATAGGAAGPLDGPATSGSPAPEPHATANTTPSTAPQRPTAIRSATGLLVSAGAILLVAYALLAVTPSDWVTGFLAYLLRPVSLFVTALGMPLAGPLVKGAVMLLAAIIVGGYFLSAFLILTGHRGARLPASLLCGASLLLFAVPGPLLLVPLLSLGGTFPIWLPSATAFMEDSASFRKAFRAAARRGWPSPATVRAPVVPSHSG
ncbi:hypothetical protein GCM10027591_05780 [Zhihengliuella somnathii]